MFGFLDRAFCSSALVKALSEAVILWDGDRPVRYVGIFGECLWDVELRTQVGMNIPGRHLNGDYQ